jgi:hypothetical protein
VNVYNIIDYIDTGNFLVLIIEEIAIYCFWNIDGAVVCIFQKLIFKLATFILLVDYTISDHI